MPVNHAAPLKVSRRPVSEHLLRVVILTTSDAQPLDVAGPYEVFALAGKKLRELGDETDRGYQVEILNMGAGRHVTGALGLSILAHGSYRAATGNIDTLLVVGGMKPWNTTGRKPFVEWLRRVAPRVRRICGVCTGAFVLAEAGLLNGRRATTHWYFSQQLASRYSEVVVNPEPIFVRDGNIYTCAGITAGMDLALALVEEDFGTEIAVRIARAYVMLLRRPGGQSQFSAPLSFASSSHSPLNRLQLWILDHLHEKVTMGRLAGRVNMSPRNFARVFARELRMTPGEYLDRVRVEAARKRLEETQERLDQIAAALVINPDGTLAGFQDKVQLDPSEEATYSHGSGRQVFQIGPLTFGIVICHEGWRYPETVRWAARRGAHVVFHRHFHVAELGGYVTSSFADPANSFHEKAMLCRAAENTCYFASVNCASAGSPTTSAVVRPDGTLLSYQPYGKEGLLIADIDIAAATGLLAARCKYV